MFGALRNLFVSRTDEDVAAESLAAAPRLAGRWRNERVVWEMTDRWSLTPDQREFLVKLLDAIGPALAVLLRMLLKV